MRTLFVFAALTVLGCSSSDKSSTGSAGLGEPAPAAKAVTACAYPDGPYGFAEGKTIPPTLTWDGLGAGGTAITYKSTDFFDCDGTKGINAVVFDSSGQWCGACQQEATQLESYIKTNWGPNGVTIITLMIEDNNHKPTTDIAVAQEWMKDFHLSNVPVVLDPKFEFAIYTGGSIGLPYNVLVNPRNMQVVKTAYEPGAGGHDPQIDALVAANQAQ